MEKRADAEKRDLETKPEDRRQARLARIAAERAANVAEHS